ncbi:three-helix bundle dimerization domain-containing protein [Agromyces bauzanensis]
MHIDEEGQALDHVIDRLAERFPDVTRDHVAVVVAEAHLGLEGHPIRDFVPVLVEHAARDRLRSEGAVPIRIAPDAPADPLDADRLERLEHERDEVDPAERIGLLNGDLGGT